MGRFPNQLPRDPDLERRIAEIAAMPGQPQSVPIQGFDVQYHPTPNAHPIHVAVPDPRRPGVLLVNVFGGLSKQQHLAALLVSGNPGMVSVTEAFQLADRILNFTPPPTPAADGEVAAPELQGS